MRARCFGALCLAAVAHAFSGCKDPTLENARGEIFFTVDRAEFGDVWVGSLSTRDLEVKDTGRADQQIRWAELAPPFELLAPPDVIPGGGTTVRARFHPLAVGDVEEPLSGTTPDGETISVILSGSAQEIPQCGEEPACHHVYFDLVQQKCVDEELADGSACDAHNACLTGGTCSSGVCVGQAVSCDDGNACTTDVCNAVTGCEHVPAPPCPGDGKCMVGVCDPSSGCGLAAAPDGTFCGPNRSCDSADVCVAGACVNRDPPDGFVCAPASPCQGEGRCSGSSCVRAAATALTSTWDYDSRNTGRTLHDFVLEPNGAVSLSGFFETPRLRANTALPHDGVAPARRCLLWNGRYLCADYESSARVVAIDLATGADLWWFDLAASRPDLAALADPTGLFMARIAVLGTDRLAALFEAFPLGSGQSTQCRTYFLAVLDAAGKLVTATQLSDPMLSVCNHPHPYGVASDSVGNLFFMFSATASTEAPLIPTAPSLLMSYSRDGVFRWKRTENLVGGELAVARGVLYPENCGAAFLASTGAPYTLPSGTANGLFGRIVASDDRMIPAPVASGSALFGYELATGQQRWTYHLPPGDSFAGAQLRLAAWTYDPAQQPMTVALAFTQRAGAPTLVAVDTRFGVEQWACPLQYNSRGDPQVFEVAQGMFALMDGASTCGHCDPPFADSSAAFHTFALPGVGVASAPWVGTFGGAGHGHHEDK